MEKIALKDFVPGAEAYMLDTAGKFYDCSKWRVEPIIIKSVGRRYVVIDNGPYEISFYKNNSYDAYLTQKSVYTPDKLLFIDKQAADEYLELNMLRKFFRGEFAEALSKDKYTLGQLRAAKSALEDNNNERSDSN